MLYRRDKESWTRVIIPEISLPRQNTVHGKYSLSLASDRNANYSYHVKIAAVNSAGQMGEWSQHHTFSVYCSDNQFNGLLKHFLPSVKL